MKKSHPKISLGDKILLYVEYCLPKVKFKFDYKEMAQVFENFYKEPHPITTLRKEFSLLKKEGFITHKTRYHKKIPVLTRKGEIKITPRLPYKKYGRWDGKWRLCIYSIPEKERTYRILLLKELENLGFRKIRDGVHISPYALFGTINRIASELGIRQYITMVESDKIDREKPAVWKIWDIWETNRLYHEFIKATQSQLARASKNRKSWPFIAKQLEQKFYCIYQKDSHLPEELLPKEWLGQKAYEKYKGLIHSY